MIDRHSPDASQSMQADAAAQPAEPGQRGWPVRVIMVGIVFALVLPGLVFCAVLINRIATGERMRSEEAALAAAFRTAGVLDRELDNLSASLVALSTSPALDTGDFAGFQRQAETLKETLGHNILLARLDGQQVVNTRRPYGTPLESMRTTGTMRTASLSRQAAVSNLFTGASTDALAIAVMYPVLRDNQVRYIIAMSLPPRYFSSLLTKQELPPGWAASVIDGTGRVVARSIDGDRFVGRPASAELMAHAQADHDLWIGTSLDGLPVLGASQRMRRADWVVAVGAPLHAIEAPLRATLALLGVTGVVTLVIACLLALKLAGSVAAPLQRLARAGTLLSQGLPVLGVRSGINEVEAVSRALVQATQDLRARADTLAMERAQLQAVIETVPVGLLIAGPDGRRVAGNARLASILGREQGADIGVGGAGLPAAGSPIEPDEHPLTRVLRGELHAELKFTCPRADGSAVWVQCIAAAIQGPDGVAGAVAAFLDIDEVVKAREAETRFAESLESQVALRTTELEQANQLLRAEMEARASAEDQLRQSQKMEAVGQLTGGIAHDFNNLLTIIMGSLDLLRRRAEDDRTRRLLDNALDGTTRAATLTARLLAFSRRQPLRPQPVDVNRLVAGMSDLLHRTLGDAVLLETVLAGGVWQTHVDPNQLENALLNLAVNARDALAAAERPDGRLVIETANAVLDAAAEGSLDADVQSGDYVRVAVTDSGTGMPADVAARVFEPFFTTKPLGQGTGLGLSQVHGFVKQSGGHVTIRTAPGQGTTITVYLPRSVEAAPICDDAPANAGREAPMASLVVLVVEDDPGVRRFSVEALRELGHVVLEADDATQALRLLEAHPEVALLLTDVALPGTSGVALSAEARRRRPDLPVLFASGYVDAQSNPTQPGPLPPGAVLLQKPFTLQALAENMQAVLTDDGATG